MNSDIIIYSAPGCTICHGMIQTLEHLKSNDKIKSYSVIDISLEPKHTEQLGIRSIPYISIKGRVFIGKMTIGEIVHWHSKDDHLQGDLDYFNWQLNKGELTATEATLKLNTNLLKHVIQLLLDTESQLSVKIGLMALIENFENSDQLREHFSIIKNNISHNDHRIRTDIIELLLLSHHPEAQQLLTEMSLDEHTEVSTAAKDALEELLETQIIQIN